MTNTKLINKMRLWSILHDNKMPRCLDCQYWLNSIKPWCQIHEKWPQDNNKIKGIKSNGNNLEIFDDPSTEFCNICEKFK